MATFIPAAIKRKLANPGERSKVSDADLKRYAPDLFAKRQYNVRRANENATLYNPNALLSGESLRTAANASAAADLNPAIAAKGREAYDLGSQRDQVAKIIAGIYNQIAPQVAGAVGQATTGSQRLSEGLAKSGTDYQGTIDQAQGAFKTQSEQDRAIRGTGLDAGTSQRLAAEFVGQRDRAAAATYGAQSLATAQSQGAIDRAGTEAAVLPAQATRDVAQSGNKFNTGIVEALGAKSDLEGTRGQLAMKYLTDLRKSEFEKSATAETLKLKGFEAATGRANVTGIDPSTGKPIPTAKKESTYEKEFAKSAAKYGYDPKQWKALGPTKRAQIISAKAKGKDHVITSGPYKGHRQSEIDAMNPKDLQALANKPAGAKPDWRTSNQVGDDLGIAKTALGQVKGGKLVSADGKTTIDLKGMNRKHVGDILISHGVSGSLVSAILDTLPQYNKGGKPHLSKETQQRLIDEGYKPSVIARSLGIPTAGAYGKQVSKKPLINLPRISK